MALSINLEASTQFGTIKVLDCYVRVLNVEVSKTEIGVRTQYLKNANGGLLQEQRYVFPYDINGENPIKQAYLHLKTLPEFANSVDC